MALTNKEGRPIQILAGRILVEPIEIEKTTASGIIIPENVNKRPNMGTIVVTGKSLTDVEMEVAVGDKVVFNEGAGMPVKIGEQEKEYLLLEQRHINYWVSP